MSTALYRRYRPESFADVIGQEHVTGPLITALEKNQINHAYLFSGPRGCGKTTSARILARCLNCAQGPTPTPCGNCQSCKELARDGGGSLDVIEMDAASHGGVDHARDLRERATFAPVRDRYKIFIIDEAHMVTREGFNALLKIVEEPPAHIKFIFATTEPQKVLGTIRSRTHHYPFRLVPPQTLGAYLEALCTQEGVKVADGVLPLVVRAGAGSVRDSLSVLDQLMAGASAQEGISYDRAVALLGFTHAELLDRVLLAFASGQAPEVFSAVSQVIETGQDPRRFVEDLLERFRDLLILKAVPDSAQSLLRGLPADQLERLRQQAQAFSSADLSAAADMTNEALNEMVGAVSPQLQLELLCARILLLADQGLAALAARLDRLEAKGGPASQLPPSSLPSHLPSQQATQPLGPVDAGLPGQSGPAVAGDRVQSLGDQPPLGPLARARQQLASQGALPESGPAVPEAAGPEPALSEPPVAPAPVPPAAARPPLADQLNGQNTLDLVLNSWSDVLAALPSPFARAQFALCEPSKFEQGALFLRADLAVLKAVKDYLPQLQSALQRILGLQVQLRAEIKKSAAASPASAAPTPASPAVASPAASSPAPAPATPAPAPAPAPATVAPADPAPVSASPAPLAPQNTPPLAPGPQAGQQAWATYGQPHSDQPPSWSQDDWNKPVTSWSVAPIPGQEDSPEAAPAPAAQPVEAQAVEAQPVEAQAAEAQPERPEPSPYRPEEEPAAAPAPLAAPAEATSAPAPVPAPAPAPAPAPQAQPAPAPKPSFRERHAAHFAAGQQASQEAQQPQEPAEAEVAFTPSDDDTPLESSVLIGQRAVEKILGGTVIDEQPLHQA